MASEATRSAVIPRDARDGFVPWPAGAAQQYRARGWWTSETIGSRPAVWAHRAPHAPALVAGEQVVTTTELAARVDWTAQRLQRIGLRGSPHNDRIVVQLPNTVELVVLLLGCARAGVVPVLALPAHRHADLSALIALSEARAMAVPSSFRGFDHEKMAADLVAEQPTLEHMLVLPSATEQPASNHLDLRHFTGEAVTETNGAPGRRLPDLAGHAEPRADDIAFLLLSGGTTGTPKLIARTHDDYLYNIRASATACGWNADTVFMGSVPITHNFALGCPGVLGAIESGGRAVLTPSPEPVAALEAIARYEVTDVAVVPAVLQSWLDEIRRTGLSLPSLRAVQVGGARLAEEVARQVGPLTGATLQQALGMAEGLINYTRPDDPIDVACQTQGRPVSPGDEVRIVDSDGKEVPEGGAGELLARGPYTIRGYWRAPEQNRLAFTADGWYRTGDVVRRHASGNLMVEGRVKDVINRGGEKISAEEVENLLYRLPSVARAAAVAAPDPQLGERVAAVIVSSDPAAPPSLEEIRSALTAAGVARFKIPEVLVVVDELPLTKVGKLDKATIRTWVAERRV